MIKPQTLKGFRDFLPEEARKRKYAIAKVSEVFELYGFDPLETPALEYASTLLGKYGEEADKLMYIFKDNGGRDVGLRYDQTVPTARVMVQYPELPKPFKRYQIQPVWRAENTQKGRYREFLQCDADILGISSYTADAEILTVFAACYEALGVDYKIVYNSRKILFSLLEGTLAADQKLWFRVLQSIDKLDKLSEDEVKAELYEKGLNSDEIAKLFFGIHNAATEQDEWLGYVIRIATREFGLNPGRIEFRSTLVRGLDYYTGLIFEAVPASAPGSSMGGGGRYDNLIGDMAGAGSPVPAVGFALGFDRIMEAVNFTAVNPTATRVYIATIADPDDADVNPYAWKTAAKLRRNGIATEVNLDVTLRIDKQLKYADRKGIPYVVVIGKNEMDSGTVMLKEMQTKTQETLTIPAVIDKLNRAS